MLNYFRINDPYRLISIFFFILLVRLPFFLGWVDLSILELRWLLLGEKMASGFVLYKEIWDNTGPLASGVYWILYEIFGRSYKVYHVLSMVLILYQSYIFNTILQENKAFKDYSYVPAFIFVLLYHLHADFFTLSPILMANTFIILAIGNLFKRIEFKSKDENIHNSGLYLGVASLFYFPATVLFFFFLLSFAFFTSMVPRRYLLSFYGFLLPLLLAWTYFIFIGASREFYTCFIYSWAYIETISYLNIYGVLIIISPLIIVLFRSLINLFSSRGFSNLQTRLQQVMFLMLFFCLVVFAMAKIRTAVHLLIFMIPFSFFVSHYFLFLKRSFLSELKLYLFIIGVLVVNYSIIFDAHWLNKIADFSKTKVRTSAWEEVTRDKKVLVLGNDINPYFHASLATPYLNWELSRIHFDNINYYDNLDHIYSYFMKDLPEIIIDSEGAMGRVFEHLPLLETKYVQNGDYYQLIE